MCTEGAANYVVHNLSDIRHRHTVQAGRPQLKGHLGSKLDVAGSREHVREDLTNYNGANTAALLGEGNQSGS